MAHAEAHSPRFRIQLDKDGDEDSLWEEDLESGADSVLIARSHSPHTPQTPTRRIRALAQSLRSSFEEGKGKERTGLLEAPIGLDGPIPPSPSRTSLTQNAADTVSAVATATLAAAAGTITPAMTKTKSKSLMDDTEHVSVSRIMALAKPEFWSLVLGTVSLAIASGSVLVLPAYAGIIVDAVGRGSRSDLNEAVITLVIIFAISSVFTMIRLVCYENAGARVVARLRKNLFDSIMQQEVGFFDLNKTGELVNRLASDCEILQNTVTVNISSGLRSAAQVVGGIGVLFYISWKLTLVMLSVTPAVVILTVIFGKRVRGIAKSRQDALAKATDTADESIANLRTVRSFTAEQVESDRYGGKVDESYYLARKVAIAMGIFSSLMALAGSAAVILVLWYGATLVLAGELSTGTLSSFMLYTITVAASMGGLSSLSGDFMKASGASTRVFQLLDRIPIGVVKSGRKVDGIVGEVKFEDVCFAYPTRPDSLILDNMNLTLSPGKVAALVGPSGTGKSTVTHLIEQFYLPHQGRILLDGIDSRLLDPIELRRHIGLVSQEPVLFATTIKDNIMYGSNKPVSDSDIERAARLANAHDFIMQLETGYDTMVGERGIQLSGGQKQRIAIARALLKDPSILLLDEATSALDAESEHLVQQALDVLMKGRTTLVIAHRLSTVKNADKVCVINQGRVVEEGTHTQLMAIEDGLYRHLVSRQLQYQD
eukprot:TRINITY_DN4141_c0_g1_i1.p1 TRINITY_DN4141_c0_g1~~TRINITY_DN4141_c0_g1_i1.p1  ORF type:complete len:714 (+),score=99.27 TRINITY_DN4141_c0_g1_i1:114-2255(+)